MSNEQGIMKIQQRNLWLKTLLRATNYIDHQIATTGQHSSRVAYWSARLGHQLGCSGNEVRQLYWAGMFHDVGKVIVPQKVLSKTAPLTENEWRIIRMHPGIGANIVRTSREISVIAPIVFAHQEKFDGSGYPGKLIGEKIPAAARILSVADSYDAITSDRVYRRACTKPEALEEISRLSGIHFDPLVVNTFLKLI